MWLLLVGIVGFIMVINRIAHELTHVLFGKWFRVKYDCIKFNIFALKGGGKVDFNDEDFHKLTKLQKSIVLLSGLFANLIIYSVIFFIEIAYFKENNFWILLIVGTFFVFLWNIFFDVFPRKSDFQLFIDELKK